MRIIGRIYGIRITFAILVFSWILLFALNAWPVSTIPNLCPDQFIGKVVEITENGVEKNRLRKQEIIFENLETLHGTVLKQHTIKIIRSSFLNFEKEKTYIVTLRNNHLCNAKELFDL